MNFLALCQRTRQECGISGTGPTTVVAQTGEMKRVVDWVATAWDDIQLRQDTWDWLRKAFTFNTTLGNATYTPALVGLTDFAQWQVEHIRVYSGTTANEYTLSYVPYDDFRHIYMRGTIPTGRPTFFTITPSLALHFYPTPNAAYTIYGDYFRTPLALSGDSSSPEMPERFHMAVVYKAMMSYGAYEAAAEVYQRGEAEYKRMLRHLEHSQTPEMRPYAELA